MQIIKKNARNLTERFIGSSFAQKSVMAAIALVISTSNVMAGSKGAAGFTKATQEVSSYQTPVSNLMKAIAAVIVLSVPSTSTSRCRTETSGKATQL